MIHQKHTDISSRLHEKNAPTLGRKGNEKAPSFFLKKKVKEKKKKKLAVITFINI